MWKSWWGEVSEKGEEGKECEWGTWGGGGWRVEKEEGGWGVGLERRLKRAFSHVTHTHAHTLLPSPLTPLPTPPWIIVLWLA